MNRIFFFLVAMFAFSACAQGPDPNETADWCYRFDFQTTNSWNVGTGVWQAGVGYVSQATDPSNPNSFLNLSYHSAASVNAQVVIVQVARPAGEPTTFAIDATAGGTFFGFTGSVPPGAVIPGGVAALDVPFQTTNPEAIGHDANVSVVTSETIVVRWAEIYGRTANPFGVSNCGDFEPTPTPIVVTNTAFPTSIPETATYTPSPTGTATATPTPTLTYTPSPTPTPGGPWCADFVFALPTYHVFNHTISNVDNWLLNSPSFASTTITQIELYLTTALTFDSGGGGTSLGASLQNQTSGIVTVQQFTNSATQYTFTTDMVAVTQFRINLDRRLGGTGTLYTGAVQRVTVFGTGTNPWTAYPCYDLTPTVTPTYTPSATSTVAASNTPGPTATRTPNPTWTPFAAATGTINPSRTPYVIQSPTPYPTYTPYPTLTAPPATIPPSTPGTVTPTTPVYGGTAIPAASGTPGIIPGDIPGSEQVDYCIPGGQMACDIVGSGGNAMGSGVGWVGEVTGRVNGVVTTWNNTAAAAPPSVPQCRSLPTSSQLCAIYYILQYTVLSGVLGSLIIPLAVVVIDLQIVFQFIRLGRAILARVAEIQKGG